MGLAFMCHEILTTVLRLGSKLTNRRTSAPGVEDISSSSFEPILDRVAEPEFR
jgi:hypothetical protein